MKLLSIAFASLLAITVSGKQCSGGQFPWHSHETGDICLPEGGQNNPSSPPSDKSCPDGWYWQGYFHCCVPKHLHHPHPKCPHGDFDYREDCCHKPSSPTNPTPSGVYNSRKRTEDTVVESRNWRAKTLSCGAEQSVCNVSNNIASNTWACVDTKKDVNFCGGCGTRDDAGQDCTTIPNAWNVGCVSGTCRVFTCESGFRISRTGKSCKSMD